MIVAVADTHAALWFLVNDSRLSSQARKLMDDAAAAGDRIAISSISLIELVYLVEKGRLPQIAYDRLRSALADSDHVFIKAPVTGQVCEAMRLVRRSEVPDMPDRIIAATAIHLGVPILSRDGRIRASSVRTIW
jgi:PIN domain nuclease of toxin-antitoxin system